MADVLAALTHENVGSATVPTWQAGSPALRPLVKGGRGDFHGKKSPQGRTARVWHMVFTRPALVNAFVPSQIHHQPLSATPKPSGLEIARFTSKRQM